ncbi:hypothetical protein VM1G_04586 [Cytospora mali]|uniref:Protein kinase domain-containing protein n=1 Tax=Cytospora mali TaxID=578113 RepID=A0A194VY38_CYTMA|nr:hypothetical protein VM1G_04586 [Valsa mali]
MDDQSPMPRPEPPPCDCNTRDLHTPECNMSQNATPNPYEAGKFLEIEVLEKYGSLPLPSTLKVLIIRTYDATMSPVVAITFQTESHGRVNAVLKLYDRRFGRDLRRIYGKHCPHNPDDEARFQSFVREGKAGPFLEGLQNEIRTSFLPPAPGHSYDETPDGPAKFEAALYQQCIEDFECEVYAHVRLRSYVPPELANTPMASYFEVKGIMMQRIVGYNLQDLPTSYLAPQDPKEWQDIVQLAVDAAWEINQRGVIMGDCKTRNVVVDGETQRPFLIDFAQCYFKDKMFDESGSETASSKEDEDFEVGVESDIDVEYINCVRSNDNPGAIGSIMTTIMKRQKGMELDIRYPDWDKVIEDIRRSKVGQT